MAKRQSTLKKKVSKRQTRKFSKKGGSKKGGSKKGGSKKGGSKKGGSKKGGSKKYVGGWSNEGYSQESAKKAGLERNILNDIARANSDNSNTRTMAVQELVARFRGIGLRTRINNSNINKVIEWAKNNNFFRALKVILAISKEKGLELSKDNQKLEVVKNEWEEYLLKGEEEEPPLPKEEQHSEELSEELSEEQPPEQP